MSSVGILEAKGIGSDRRFLLFMMVCIPLRLSFSLLSYRLRDSSPFGVFLLLLGLISITVNARKMRGDPWWSRKVHLGSAIALVSTFLLSKANPSPALNRGPSLVLLLDVLYGLVSSLVIKPFV